METRSLNNNGSSRCCLTSGFGARGPNRGMDRDRSSGQAETLYLNWNPTFEMTLIWHIRYLKSEFCRTFSIIFAINKHKLMLCWCWGFNMDTNINPYRLHTMWVYLIFFNLILELCWHLNFCIISPKLHSHGEMLYFSSQALPWSIYLNLVLFAPLFCSQSFYMLFYSFNVACCGTILLSLESQPPDTKFEVLGGFKEYMFSSNRAKLSSIKSFYFTDTCRWECNRSKPGFSSFSCSITCNATDGECKFLS